MYSIHNLQKHQQFFKNNNSDPSVGESYTIKDFEVNKAKAIPVDSVFSFCHSFRASKVTTIFISHFDFNLLIKVVILVKSKSDQNISSFFLRNKYTTV